ncbi:MULTISPECIES: ArsR/SmtB family transcription factor [unclassified Rhizobium]|uniref:ArsR/SmtB family transcription factor n=1 Tax=Rhizobium sp. PP-CC-3G-465 TaxID=2135648 RepID=UPI001404B27A
MNACQAARAANLLSIVANQSRLQMIKIMLKNDVSVGELANMTGLSSSATSQHLSLMKNMNILVQRRQNTTQYCSINLLFADFFLRLILVTELQAAVFDASQPAAVP